MTSSQDAKGQTHVAAASRKEVEEESLLDAHASIEQDNKVSYNRDGHRKGVESGHGTPLDETASTMDEVWVKKSQTQRWSWDEGTFSSNPGYGLPARELEIIHKVWKGHK